MKDESSRVVYWGQPARTGAAFDFRSDVITTPSLNILNAMTHATLNDDVYQEDHTTTSFEHELARMCGHEAAAFVVTGTMANQLALRTLLDQAPPYAILADASSHIVHWEAGGVAFLSGAMVQATRPMNGRYLTLEDVEKHAVITNDVHKCPTRVISIENTSSGSIVPLLELQRIKTWAEKHNLKVHIDGARLWEAVAAGAGTLRDFASCADLVTLDFSKNLGAPMGAMVLGSSDDIGRLKRIRKGVGGGLRQAGVLAAAARQAVVENFGLGEVATVDTLKRTHDLAKTVGRWWTDKGGRLLREVETNMVWLDLKLVKIGVIEWNLRGRHHGILLDGNRLLIHHQISSGALTRLEDVMHEVMVLGRPDRGSQRQDRSAKL